MQTQYLALKDSPEVKRIVKAAFPNYKKTQAGIRVWGGEKRINSYWDGGSREEFALVEISTGRQLPLPTRSHPAFDIGGGHAGTGDFSRVDHVGNVYLTRLPAGFALVEAGTFCGKPALARVTVSAETLLPGIALTVD